MQPDPSIADESRMKDTNLTGSRPPSALLSVSSIATFDR